jgi:type IV secretory pathway VirB10-like protein
MNKVPPGQEPYDDADERYRRASALDPSRPSEAVRRAVLEHAAQLAVGRTAAASRKLGGREGSQQGWRRPAVFGGLAAAAIAGLMLAPRWWSPPRERAVAALAPAATVAPGAAPEAPAVPEPPAPPASRAVPGPAAVTAPPAGHIVAAAPPSAPPSPAVSADTAAREAPAPAAQSLLQPQASSDSAREARRAVASAAPAPAIAARRNAIAGALNRPDLDGALRDAAASGDVAQLQSLLPRAADIDARDARGRTALMLATRAGQTTSVALLLAHGADPNAVDADGTTPLQAAVAAQQPAIAAALRRYGGR